MTTEKSKPYQLSGPGPVIKERLEIRGWTQEDLSDIMDMSLKTVNKIIQNKQSITLDTAKALADIFDNSPQFWINLDTNYRLSLIETKKTSPIKAKSDLYRYMPISELFKKGWLKKTKVIDNLEKQIKEFWGINTTDLSFLEGTSLAFNYRKSSAHDQFDNNAAIVWCQMAKNSVSFFKSKKYDVNKLSKLYSTIHSYTSRKDGVEDFLKALNDAGVVFMLLPHLQKTYIDGATFMTNDIPAIVYTGRYKRYDNFWFTIAHEIAHLLLGHVKNDGNILIDDLHSKDQDTNIKEEDANRMANDALLHDKILEYLEDSLNYLTEGDIYSCAEKFDIHPSIIIGALAHRKIISFAHIHTFSKDRDIMSLIPEKYFIENYLLKKVA